MAYLDQVTVASGTITADQGGTWTVTADQGGTWTVGLSGALPAGSNTIGAVTQASGPWTINLTEIGGSTLTLGQATMAASVPVTIASNQSAIPSSQSGTWTVSLSSGANTIGAVTQASGPWTSNITQIGGTTLSLGSKVSASSIPVVIASDQGSLAVTQSGSWSVGVTGTVATSRSPWGTTYSAAPTGATLTAVASSSTTLAGYNLGNTANSSASYVQFFDSASTAGITLGTTAPKLSLPIPQNGVANLDFGAGIKFNNGIVIATTTTRAGSTAPGSAVDVTLWTT